MPPTLLVLSLPILSALSGLATLQVPRVPSAAAPPPGRAGAIVVVAPGRGASWAAGSAQRIDWQRRGRLGPVVAIVLLRKGQPSQLIAAAAPNTGSRRWTVPAGLAPGTYRVGIATTDGAVRGTGELFRVVARTAPDRVARRPQVEALPGARLTPQNHPPAQPTGLWIAKSGSTSSGSGYDFVGLMWSDNADNEAEYVVSRWGGPCCESGYTVIARLPPNSTSFEDVGVDPRGGSYWWSVEARNVFGASSTSITIQNDQAHNPVGGTQTVEVPEDPSEVCKEQGGVWLGWGLNYCSQALGELYSAAQTLLDPVVQVYAGYFAVVGGGVTTYALPEDVVRALAPHYGEALLREVRYGASQHTVSDNTAMTDCSTIYFPAGSGVVTLLRSGGLLAKAGGALVNPDAVRWLLHELQHARQCADLYGRENYAIRWFGELGVTLIAQLITDPASVSNRSIHDAMPMEGDAVQKESLAASL